MAEQEMHQVLETGWQGYQAGPASSEWTGKLQKVLHDEVVWHEVDPDARPGDYVGKGAVMDHFRFCREGGNGTPAPYGVPGDRKYHVLKGVYAIVTDQVKGEEHRCTDIYRLVSSESNDPPYLICEMWTCVTHPVEAGYEFDPTTGKSSGRGSKERESGTGRATTA